MIQEKRKEPRFNVEIPAKFSRRRCYGEGYLGRITNVSLHGALLSSSVPLRKGTPIYLTVYKGTEFPITIKGRVKWCRNGSDVYRIGIYLEEELDIQLSLKEIMPDDSSKKLEKEAVLYRDLIKKLAPQLYVGFLIFFLNKDLSQMIEKMSSEINIILLHSRKEITASSIKENIPYKKDNNFICSHYKNLKSLINKFIVILNRFNEKFKQDSSSTPTLIDTNYLIESRLDYFKEVFFNLNNINIYFKLSKNIPLFLSDRSSIENGIDMMFVFLMNYITFYKANKIYIETFYDNGIVTINLYNNGSRIFPEKEISISKKTQIPSLKSKFMGLLHSIYLMFIEHCPELFLFNEAGNNMLSLNIKIATPV